MFLELKWDIKFLVFFVGIFNPLSNYACLKLGLLLSLYRESLYNDHIS